MRIGNTGRGIHPPFDTNTFAAWSLDESSGLVDVQDIIGNARPLTAFGAVPRPAVALGSVGNALVYTGTQVVSRAANAADITWGQQQSWTVSQWVRMDAFPTAGNGVVLYSLAGRSDNDTAADNIVVQSRAVGILTGLATICVPEMQWEQGAGVNVISTTSTMITAGTISDNPFRFQLGQWTYVTWRKRPGVGALVDLDLFVNGGLCQTFTGPTMVNTNGTTTTNTRHELGAWHNTAGGVVAGFTGRLSGAYLWSTALTDMEITEHYRRGVGAAFPTKIETRLFLADQSDILRDVSDQTTFGEDFLRSVSIRDDIDQQTESMEIVLSRDQGEISMAQFKGDSVVNNPTLVTPFTPFLAPWRRTRFDFARVPLWITPVTTDWQERFNGRVDSVNDGGEGEVQLSCRDQGAALADYWILDERQYPTIPLSSREVVMQAIVNDNGALATIYVPEPTQSVMVQKGTTTDNALSRGHLLPTLRTVAGMIGWDINYKRFDPLTNAFRFTLFDPFRVRIAPDFILSPENVVITGKSQLDVSEVRNRVRLAFADSSTVNSQQQWPPNNADTASPSFLGAYPVTFADAAASIAAFGMRTIDIVEDSSSQIDTLAEGNRMAEAIVSDVKDPYHKIEKIIPCFPELGTQDTIWTLPDGIRVTSTLGSAVRSIRHTFERERSSTTFDAEGKPAGGFVRWLDSEAGRHGKPPVLNPDQVLTGKGMSTLFTGVVDMVNRSTYLGGQKFVEVKNADFSRFTFSTSRPPDSWDVTAGAWGTDLLANSATQLRGGYSLQINNTTAQITSQLLTLSGEPGTPFSVETVWQRVSGDDLVQIDVAYYNSVKALISTTAIFPQPYVVGGGQFLPVSSATGTWFRSRADGLVPPGGARFVSITPRGRQVGGAFNQILVDEANFFQTGRRFKTAVIDTGTFPIWAPWLAAITALQNRNIPFAHYSISNPFISQPDVYDYTLNVPIKAAPTTDGGCFVCKESGTWDLEAKIWFSLNISFGGNEYVQLDVVKNGSYVAATGVRTAGTIMDSFKFEPREHTTAGAGGVGTYRINTKLYLAVNDRITIDMRNLQGGAETITIIPADPTVYPAAGLTNSGDYTSLAMSYSFSQ